MASMMNVFFLLCAILHYIFVVQCFMHVCECSIRFYVNLRWTTWRSSDVRPIDLDFILIYEVLNTCRGDAATVLNVRSAHSSANITTNCCISCSIRSSVRPFSTRWSFHSYVCNTALNGSLVIAFYSACMLTVCQNTVQHTSGVFEWGGRERI